jgi:site-specific DNA-cytosine methylase
LESNVIRFSSILSLFDGISCGQIAINRIGIKYDNYFASEIDKYAINITQKNYPNTIQLGDVTKIKTDDLPKIDLLIGGSPCQSFSNANGDGKGFEGKSGLFWEYLRLLKETQPKYFLFENVIMKKKEWEDIISNALGVTPILIDSKLVSAQRRPRLYWTNIPNVKQPDDKGILFKDILDSNSSKYELSDTLKNRFKQTHIDDGTKLVIGTTVIDGKIGQRDRVYGINNKIPTLTATDYKQPKQVLVDGILRKVTPLEFERLQTLPDNYTLIS